MRISKNTLFELVKRRHQPISGLYNFFRLDFTVRIDVVANRETHPVDAVVVDCSRL